MLTTAEDEVETTAETDVGDEEAVSACEEGDVEASVDDGVSLDVVEEVVCSCEVVLSELVVDSLDEVVDDEVVDSVLLVSCAEVEVDELVGSVGGADEVSFADSEVGETIGVVVVTAGVESTGWIGAGFVSSAGSDGEGDGSRAEEDMVSYCTDTDESG